MKSQSEDFWSQQLKAQTRLAHDLVERSALPLLAQDLTLSSYRKFLGRLAKFISLHEPIIEESNDFDPWINQLDYSKRKKLASLLRDYYQLEGLCFDEQDYHIKPDLQAPLPLETTAQRLGFLYVLEGSTLGGLIIAKRLEMVLQLSSIGGIHYFNIYRNETWTKWTQFIKVLNNYCHQNPTQYEAILQSSLQTFTSYHVSVLNS
jgi:heme oxygenase